MTPTRRWFEARRHRRRGITVVVILGLIAVSLSLAYTITRSQNGLTQVAGNTNIDLLSRQAAMTGFATALRKMHDSTWAGVNAPISGNLAAGQSFSVTLTTGDASLSATDTDWPYRVTMLVVGTAVDPARPTISATHRIQAILRLVPRQIAADPSNFSTMVGYTVYQYAQDTFDLELPCRVVGSLWLQGSLTVAGDYPTSSGGQNQFLQDLNTMQFVGLGDNRPLTGPVYLPTSRQSSNTLSDLNYLGVAANNTNPSTVSGWNYPGTISSYSLYPGGQSYSVASCPVTLTGTSLKSDPRTNPLGLFQAAGNVTIGNNATIVGTLLAGGDVTINGTGVVLQPVGLTALQGATQGVQLPALVTSGKVNIGSSANVTIMGLVASWDAFNVVPGTKSTALNLQGRVICKGFVIDDRNEWIMNNGQWNVLSNSFINQLLNWLTAVWFYPQYVLQQKSLSYVPTLTVMPETTPVTYHWKDASNTIYVANSADGGLRWTVLKWSEDF